MTVKKIMGQVSIARMSAIIERLARFETRYPHEKQIQASEYICSEMSRYIPETNYHEYEQSSLSYFSREEDGQDGSKAYIKDIASQSDTIVAVINLDMIAFGSAREDIDLVTRPSHAWLVESAHSIGKAYGFNVKKVIKEACF